jgi:NADH:ubiquinone oxidoreductase subunit F (NADH-binding)
MIIDKGVSWYTSIGTGDVSKNPWGGSKGTKIFALVGKVMNTGLVEVPMGTTLRQIIYDVGGGIRNRKKFKAVQTGGPSGGCIPAQYLDTPIDYETLTQLGSIMGSGGLIVLDENTCMVDIAHYYLSFTESESCGKCVPCRIGTKRMLEILTRIKQGEGRIEDIDKLVELGETIKDSSLCQLGQTAPNPVLSTIRYFRDEYEAHTNERICPAGACKALTHYYVDKEKCTGCLLCAKNCPQQAISGQKKEPQSIDQDKCTKCGLCYESCKFDAILTK